jgi:hypothetical protein
MPLHLFKENVPGSFSSAYCAVCVLQTKVLYLSLPQYGSNIYGSVRQYADIMCDKTTYRIFVAAMRCSFFLTDCYFGAANSSCVSKCSQLTFCTWRTEQDMAIDRKTYPLCSEIFVSYFVCRNNPVFLVKLSTYSDMLFISSFYLLFFIDSFSVTCRWKGKIPWRSWCLLLLGWGVHPKYSVVIL